MEEFKNIKDDLATFLKDIDKKINTVIQSRNIILTGETEKYKNNLILNLYQVEDLLRNSGKVVNKCLSLYKSKFPSEISDTSSDIYDTKKYSFQPNENKYSVPKPENKYSFTYKSEKNNDNYNASSSNTRNLNSSNAYSKQYFENKYKNNINNLNNINDGNIIGAPDNGKRSISGLKYNYKINEGENLINNNEYTPNYSTTGINTKGYGDINYKTPEGYYKDYKGYERMIPSIKNANANPSSISNVNNMASKASNIKSRLNFNYDKSENEMKKIGRQDKPYLNSNYNNYYTSKNNYSSTNNEIKPYSIFNTNIERKKDYSDYNNNITSQVKDNKNTNYIDTKVTPISNTNLEKRKYSLNDYAQPELKNDYYKMESKNKSTKNSISYPNNLNSNDYKQEEKIPDKTNDYISSLNLKYKNYYDNDSNDIDKFHSSNVVNNYNKEILNQYNSLFGGSGNAYGNRENTTNSNNNNNSNYQVPNKESYYDKKYYFDNENSVGSKDNSKINNKVKPSIPSNNYYSGINSRVSQPVKDIKNNVYSPKTNNYIFESDIPVKEPQKNSVSSNNYLYDNKIVKGPEKDIKEKTFSNTSNSTSPIKQNINNQENQTSQNNQINQIIPGKSKNLELINKEPVISNNKIDVLTNNSINQNKKIEPKEIKEIKEMKEIKENKDKDNKAPSKKNLTIATKEPLPNKEVIPILQKENPKPQNQIEPKKVNSNINTYNQQSQISKPEGKPKMNESNTINNQSIPSVINDQIPSEQIPNKDKDLLQSPNKKPDQESINHNPKSNINLIQNPLRPEENLDSKISSDTNNQKEEPIPMPQNPKDLGTLQNKLIQNENNLDTKNQILKENNKLNSEAQANPPKDDKPNQQTLNNLIISNNESNPEKIEEEENINPIDTANKIKEKANKVSELVVLLNENEDLFEILSQLFGTNVIELLLSDDIDDNTINAIYNTIEEIEKLKEKDEGGYEDNEENDDKNDGDENEEIEGDENEENEGENQEYVEMEDEEDEHF